MAKATATMATMATMEGFISNSYMMLAAFRWRGGGSCDATEDSDPGEFGDNAGDGGFDCLRAKVCLHGGVATRSCCGVAWRWIMLLWP